MTGPIRITTGRHAARLLRDMRLHAGLQQDQLAARLDIGIGDLRARERGARAVSVAALIATAKACGWEIIARPTTEEQP